MIKISNKQVLNVINDKLIIEVWTHNEMVWPENSIETKVSCFAKGFWINEYPWTDHYSWKNN